MVAVLAVAVVVVIFMAANVATVAIVIATGNTVASPSIFHP